MNKEQNKDNLIAHLDAEVKKCRKELMENKDEAGRLRTKSRTMDAEKEDLWNQISFHDDKVTELELRIKGLIDTNTKLIKKLGKGSIDAIHSDDDDGYQWFRNPAEASEKLGYSESDIVECADNWSGIDEWNLRWSEGCPQCKDKEPIQDKIPHE